MRYHAYIKIWKPKMERNMVFFLSACAPMYAAYLWLKIPEDAIHRMIWQCWLSIKWQFRQKGGSRIVTLDMRPRRDVLIWHVAFPSSLIAPC